MQEAIYRYKYRAERFWAPVFARIVVGHLDRHAADFARYDLIAPMPGYHPPRSSPNHTEEVIGLAAELGPAWPFTDEIIIKRHPTARFAGRSYRQRLEMATSDLRRSLLVRDPGAIAGARVLIYDDVCTSGLTLREVALKLRAAGAVEVAGLVLARQTYRSARR